MKAVFVIALLVCSVALISADCDYDNGNGKPICTANNVKIGRFRNNWDNNCFWDCVSVNEEPVTVRCETGGYLDAEKKCVDWTAWSWTPPCNPPTA